jgi:uncharacterized protein YkwD
MHLPPLRRRTTATIAAAAVASALLAGFTLGTAGSATAAETPTEASYATAVFNQLNNERAANGLPALAWNNTLASCSAYNHDELMAADNTMSHQLPGEPALGDRITACGYQWTAVGENIGWTTDMSQAGALSIETSMYNEVPPNDGHRQNILSTTFTEVGVAVVLDSTNHKLWLTEDFGRPVNSQPTPTQTTSTPTSPATSTSTTTPGTPSATETKDAKAVFALLNTERTNNGLPALTWNSTLANCSAYQHSQLMAADNTMSHQLPGEPALGDRITACSYQWSSVGENIGWTTTMTAAGAKAVEKSMYNEKPPNDGHRQNILSATFTQVGIGVVLDNVNHKLWITEDFGRPTG